jgi:hypothetical protein
MIQVQDSAYVSPVVVLVTLAAALFAKVSTLLVPQTPVKLGQAMSILSREEKCSLQTS